MATNNRTPHYFMVRTGVYGRLQLDADKYPSAVATALGFSPTAPTGDVLIIDSAKALLRTGKLVKAKATMFNGTGESTKRRVVNFYCDVDKVATASSQLANDTAGLGNGVNQKSWKFGDIRIG